MALATSESSGTRTGLFGLSKPSQWAVTVAATALSTYALDAVATVAGLSLAASGVLQGFGHLHVLMFLAATYLIWGLGLHANLKANWALLQETGTSTNALSKAAHDLMKLRTASLRVQRFAASVGYTGTELAKEAPYYAGVFGAVLFTDSVSSNRCDRLPRRRQSRRRSRRIRPRPPGARLPQARPRSSGCRL